jgi:hypothetical protein
MALRFEGALRWHRIVLDESKGSGGVVAVVMAVVSGGRRPGAAEAGHGCLGGVLGRLG